MVSRRVPLLTAALAVGGCLVAPASALAGVGAIDVSNDAEIIASAFDGGGDSAVTDRAGRIGFSEFLASVEKSDRNADSGRSARSTVVHDTQILEDGDDTLGLDSTATATARARDPQPGDSFVPVGRGTSDLSVDFDVSETVMFSLTGDISTSTEAARRAAHDSTARRRGSSGCTRVIVTSPDGTTHIVHSPGGCGSPSSAEVGETGELQPGPHNFSVLVQAQAGGAQDTKTAEAEYDLKLRFCTITATATGPDESTDGTAGDDVICGTNGDDTIFGLGGSDRIFGLGGVDILEGGSADDSLDAGEGNDLRVHGGLGNDTIQAGAGDDGPGAPFDDLVVAGGPGNDEIDGGPGNDILYGRCGEELPAVEDVCPATPPAPGEADDDNLSGGFGDDILSGDAGVNLLRGDKGSDSGLAGELGDTLLMGGGPDAAIGGAGNDTIDGGPGDDNRLLGLLGSGGRDNIAGGTGDDLIGGDSGNDDLFGEAGSDSLLGLAGLDCLTGGSSKDVLQGGSDDDTLLAKDGSKDTGSGGAGPDRGRFDPVDAVASVSNRNFQGGC